VIPLPLTTVPTPFALPFQESFCQGLSQPECNDRLAATASGCGDCASSPCIFYFPKPARFTESSYEVPPCEWTGLAETEHKRPVAVIHEDMTFAVWASGEYLVQFVISSPALPTQLKLQFTWNLHNSPPCDSNAAILTTNPASSPRPFTITLPTIFIHPQRLDPPRDGVYTIRHRGHSQSLEGIAAQNRLKNCYTLTRRGVATFGFPSSDYIDKFEAGQFAVPDYHSAGAKPQ
jgi:hypothetical protein